MLLGKLPPIYGLKKKVKLTPGQVWGLFSFAMSFGGLCLAVGAARSKVAAAGLAGKVLATIQEIFSMAMAWCFFFFAKWAYYKYLGGPGVYGAGKKIVGYVYIALVATPMAYAAIVICDYIADRSPSLQGMSHMIEGFVLLIGLTWEKTFMTAMENLQGDDEETSRPKKLAWMIAMTLVLCAFVMPTWLHYILPKAQHFKHLKDHKGHGEGHAHGEGHDDSHTALSEHGAKGSGEGEGAAGAHIGEASGAGAAEEAMAAPDMDI
jgi:hypothetical protein